MAAQFDRDFDDILNDILVDYVGLENQPDTSVGSTAWIIASVLASMVWGLYRYQDYISAQHFPDTCDTDSLNHWGLVYDISRLTDETDADYLNRILSFLRQPPAGGNALDYKNWALDHDECYLGYTADSTYYNAYVTVESNPDDILGTVGVFTIPTDETSISLANKQGLRLATETYIESVRPLGLLSVGVFDSTMLRQAIDIDIWPITDSTVNSANIKAAVETDMSSMIPGETLHKSTLTCIALNYGADYAVVNTPAAEDTTAGNIYFYRDDGNVTINYQG
jgi:hypothetical protein